MHGRLSAIVGCAAAVMLALLALAAPAAARTGPVQLGAAVSTDPFLFDPDPRYRGTLAAYDSITAETAMKISALQPQRGQFDFTVADALVAFAEANGQQVFGHTLSWCADSTLPGWLRNGTWTRNQLLTVLQNHITTVMGRYGGRVTAWDVVNEALNEDGTRRDCLWQRVIGDDWVEQAFHFARAADPTAKLYYNETRADVQNPKHEATLALVQDFRARGVPIDGVGLQFHLNNPLPSQAQMEESLRRVGELALEAHISELDVPVWNFGGTQERKFARQAEVYRAIATACQAQQACVRITTWGFTDRYTWRLPWASSLPLPFDSEYRPKPAWTALQEVLRPPPAPPPPPPAPQAAQAATVQAAQTAPRPPLGLVAKLRRQRLRTWLARRALTAVVEIGGSESAHLELVVRARGRTLARARVDTAADLQTVRMSLSRAALRRLRELGGARVVLVATASDPDGRIARARTATRPG
jgi:endo-1,4-beta-xylanase